MNKADRRVRKTKKALQEGLAELMLKKDIRKITVQELTDQADVHRATFYSHYKDIYDLYEQMEAAIIYELSLIISSDSSRLYDNIYHTIIDYVYNHAKMCRMFLDQNMNSSFYVRIRALLEEKYLEFYLVETGQKELTDQWKYLIIYHIQGCLAIIYHWAKDNFSYPKEKMTEIIAKVDSKFDSIL